jgi:MoaA/NifB/PqqE/SkfB family radical SAM enzyme
MQMVRVAKAAGCQVGTTTNGMAITDDRIAEVVESGMDILAFSLAGTDERNDEVRRGTKIEKILETIRRVKRAKEHFRRDEPAVHIAYLLLRSGLEQVERLPALLSGHGIAHVVISTLDFIPSQDLAEESFLWRDEQAHEAVCAKLAAVAAEGERCGLPVSFHLPGPVRKGTTCTENIHRALFVGADGTVSPCVYRNIPVRGKRLAAIGSGELYERLIFGKVEDESLPSIWHGRSHDAFRKAFMNGSPGGMCGSCPKRLSLLL